MKRRRGRPKEKKVALLPYKRAISQIGIYKKGLAEGKELPSDIVEQFVIDISPYLNKKGDDIKKSTLKSNKQRRQFNKIIKEFTDSAYSTRAKRQQVRKSREEGLETSKFVKDNSGTYTATGKELLETFTALSRDKLMENVGFTCGDVIKLSTTVDDVTSDDIRAVAEYILRDMNSRTPSYLKGELEQDDTYNTAQRLLEYMKDNEIPPEDIESVFDNLKKEDKQ